jgi:hypothetical protein
MKTGAPFLALMARSIGNESDKVIGDIRNSALFGMPLEMTSWIGNVSIHKLPYRDQHFWKLYGKLGKVLGSDEYC